MNRKTKIVLPFLIAVMSLLGGVKAVAQEVAHFDRQAVLSSMPEREKAKKELQQFQQKLQKNIQEMSQEYQRKLTKLQEGKEDMTETEKKMMEDELKTLRQRISKARQRSQKDVQSQRQELLQPILDKLNAAVKEVAKEEGYTYIIAKATCAYCGGTDVTAKIKQKLREKRQADSKKGAGKSGG